MTWAETAAVRVRAAMENFIFKGVLVGSCEKKVECDLIWMLELEAVNVFG